LDEETSRYRGLAQQNDFGHIVPLGWEKTWQKYTLARREFNK
jgi:hypothetical protein